MTTDCHHSPTPSAEKVTLSMVILLNPFPIRLVKLTHSYFLNTFSKHRFSQTVGVRALKLWENIYPTTCVTSPTSHVICHKSCVICQMFFSEKVVELAVWGSPPSSLYRTKGFGICWLEILSIRLKFSSCDWLNQADSPAPFQSHSRLPITWN